MLRVGVLGACGYAGGELVRILLNHPEVQMTYLGDDYFKGRSMGDAFPSFKGANLPDCQALDPDAAAEKADVILIALHNGWAMSAAPKLLAASKKVIDFGADFRFRNPDIYNEWYKLDHTAPDLTKSCVYGLPELKSDAIKSASLIANPGCYPTSAILALAPLLANKLIDTSTIIFDSKSGVSGAGRANLAIGFLFAEVDSSVKPYNIGVHRHTPEIEQELSELAGSQVTISFTPHLIPMPRGILTTAYASLAAEADTASVLSVFRDFYRNAPFVIVLDEGELPATKNVQGSNYCQIGLKVDERTNRVVVASAIDNLVKGAAGQAVQNMNLVCGLDERTGLNFAGLYP